MNNTVWKYVKPLNNCQIVKEFLSQNSIQIPVKLESILEEYNGGRPPKKEFFTATGREYVFKALLSYNEEDRETIYMVYSEMFRKLGLLPIGTDTAGNIICFDLTEGKYVLYNHETEMIEDILEMPFDV